jgi:PAS domain S-box-containing protein
MRVQEHEFLAARILVVDDQEAHAHRLQSLLEAAGYTGVTTTLDPAAVCALHRRDDYDLILLDLQMPGVDGFEVMAALQAQAADAYLPVIVLTDEPAHKPRALQGGAVDFISKPLDLLEVRTRIHNMLEVRLLYRRLEAHNRLLEQTVRHRTAELLDSEARYRCLTELASDWYWEQDECGHFTRISGPVMEMLGIRADLPPGTADQSAAHEGWDEGERARLRATIAARQPFLDFAFSRVNSDGSQQQFRVSGEPMFTSACRFVGYRGIGVETTARPARLVAAEP